MKITCLIPVFQHYCIRHAYPITAVTGVIRDSAGSKAFTPQKLARTLTTEMVVGAGGRHTGNRWALQGEKKAVYRRAILVTVPQRLGVTTFNVKRSRSGHSHVKGGTYDGSPN